VCTCVETRVAPVLPEAPYLVLGNPSVGWVRVGTKEAATVAAIAIHTASVCTTVIGTFFPWANRFSGT
jgi:hypothetical protein